jgi:hypothetical protein
MNHHSAPSNFEVASVIRLLWVDRPWCSTLTGPPMLHPTCWVERHLIRAHSKHIPVASRAASAGAREVIMKQFWIPIAMLFVCTILTACGDGPKPDSNPKPVVDPLVDPKPIDTPPLPKIMTFSVNREILPPSGGQVTVTWEVQHASSIVIDGLGDVEATGSQAIQITSNRTLTLNASGAGGSQNASVRIKVNEPLPINPAWESYQFDGKLGATKTLPILKAFSAHVGGDDRQENTFVYEPPEGWTVLAYRLIENGRYGDSGYSASLTARNSSFISEERLRQVISNAGDYAVQVGDDSYKNKLEEVQGLLREKFRHFESKNNHLEIPCFVQSHRIRGPFGIVIDTKTAFLDLDVEITLARMMTDAEAAILEYKLKRLIDQNLDPKTLLE